MVNAEDSVKRSNPLVGVQKGKISGLGVVFEETMFKHISELKK